MIYDIIVIGGGPAGLTAALYACRADKTVLILEKNGFGGQITSSPKVENIPGFSVISGMEFADKLTDQVLGQGAEMEIGTVTQVVNGDIKTVLTEDAEYQGRAVVIATGTKHRCLGLPEEESYIGSGISFCAVCDGAFYGGRNVAVVGGGNSALQEALLLSDVAKHVSIVQNLAFLTGEQKLRDLVAKKDNISVTYEATVTGYIGSNGALSGITVQTPSGTSEISVDGVFLAVGLEPQNEPFQSLLSLHNGYIAAGETCKTEVDGIFVAGDCREKSIRQVATACSDGAIAALAACRYLDR